MRAMILAAGLGTRMKPLTDKTPKPLLPVAGKPLIAHHIERLSAAGFDEIVVNVSYLGDQIERFLRAKEWGANIVVTVEPEPLETAGGIVNALSFLQGAPFLLFNGDVWLDLPAEKLAQRVTANVNAQPGAHLILVENPDHNVSGDFRLLQGEGCVRLLTNARGDGNTHGEALTYSGVGIYDPRLFQAVEPGKRALGPLLRQWIDEGKVTGEKFKGYWLDVGTPSRLQQLEDFMLKNR